MVRVFSMWKTVILQYQKYKCNYGKKYAKEKGKTNITDSNPNIFESHWELDVLHVSWRFAAYSTCPMIPHRNAKYEGLMESS